MEETYDHDFLEGIDRLKDIIGLNITEVREKYVFNTENNLHVYHVYIKLQSNLIFFLPFKSPDSTIKFQSHNSLAEYFKDANYLSTDRKKIIEGHQIKDFHFFCTGIKRPRLDENNEAGFMELSSGYYITIKENWVKATDNTEKPDLIILNQKEFESLTKRKNVKSLLKDILKNGEIEYDDYGIVI